MNPLIPALALLSLSIPLISSTAEAACQSKQLTFSADGFRAIPAPGSAMVWGGNATGGDHVIDPPYSSSFLGRVSAARNNGIEVFAYLEGPCGDTAGKNDGERDRCARLHRDYNDRFSPNTPDTPYARWKPFTLKQLKLSKKYEIDHCEIDNLSNNVTIPLIPLLREIKALYDNNQIRCRFVLKNVSVREIDAIKSQIAPTPAAADFISPFHIFEADDTSEKSSLDAAMRRLKGAGAVAIVSSSGDDRATEHYGDYFTKDRFTSCER